MKIPLKKIPKKDLVYLYNSLVKGMQKYTKNIPSLNDKLYQSLISDLIDKEFNKRILKDSKSFTLKLAYHDAIILAECVVANDAIETIHQHEKYKQLIIPYLI